MHKRCRPSDPQRRYYFDRGIKVCERWKSFAHFLADMGQRPKGTTLDRIDNDRDYSPANCRWADTRLQRRNRRDTKFYTYAGKTMCLTDWMREITGDPKARIRSDLV